MWSKAALQRAASGVQERGVPRDGAGQVALTSFKVNYTNNFE